MERVDMVFTQSWFSGRKSKSVDNFPSSRICDFDGISPPWSAVQTRRIPSPGQISQFHPPGMIMRSRVRALDANRKHNDSEDTMEMQTGKLILLGAMLVFSNAVIIFVNVSVLPC